MRQVYDAHRSLTRLMAELFPDWDIWAAKVEPQEGRPYAVVRQIQVPDIAHSGRAIVQLDQPFIVYLYPALSQDALAGHLQKLQVEETLFQAFFVDHAMRLPLYDYSTGGPDGALIPWEQPGPLEPGVAAFDADGNPVAYDMVQVTQYQINSAQDAEDERRWAITLTLRLAWRRHGRLISGPPVQLVNHRFEVR